MEKDNGSVNNNGQYPKGDYYILTIINSTSLKMELWYNCFKKIGDFLG